MPVQLNDFQRYLIEEFVEEWQEGRMGRRDLVRRAVYLTGGTASAATVLLSMGCSAPAPTPTAVPAKPAVAPPTAAVAPPTAAPAPPTAAVAPPTAAAPAPPTAAVAPPTVAPASAAPPPSPTAAPAPTAAPTVPAKAPPAPPSAAASPAAAPPPQPTPTGARSPLATKSDDPAVDAKKVDFPGEAGKVFGYLARPKAAGSYAGLIVIHENRGMTPHFEDVTRRAAKEGFIALAVDLVSRAGGTDAVGDDARISGILGQAKQEDFVADLGSGIKYLQSLDGTKKDKIGVIGFCFGGGYVWRLLVSNKAVLAAVPFYGPPPPLDQIPNTNAAVLGVYAELDQRLTSTAPAVEEALKKAGKTYEIKVMPGANHAFHNDTGPSWNEKAAVDAWQMSMAWFKKYLA